MVRSQAMFKTQLVPKVSLKAIGETAEQCVEGCRPLVDIPGTAYMHL